MSLNALAWASEQNCGGPSSKVTLFAIANFANPKTWCGYPSQAEIADVTEQSVDSIQRRIPELVDRGLLMRIPLRCEGRRTVDFLILQPSPYFGKPLAEIEPLIPRRFTIDVKFTETYVAADCGSATLPQPAENATALVRQHEPVREPEEERETRAREGKREAPEGPPSEQREPAHGSGLTVEAAFERLGKIWPDFALENGAMISRALDTLTPSERLLAVDRVPEFLAFHRSRRGKAKLPFLHNYLGEKHRWSALPRVKPASIGQGEHRFIGSFDRAWWWLFFDAITRLGLALLDWKSNESTWLRDQVSRARTGIGWRIAAARLEEIEASGMRLVQVPVDGAEFKAWAAALKAAGVDLPRPDKAGWIFVPSQWPPDDRERDEDLREAAEIMGVER